MHEYIPATSHESPERQLGQATEVVDAMLQQHQHTLSDFNLASIRSPYYPYDKHEDEGPATPNVRHSYTAQAGLIPLELESQLRAIDVLTETAEAQLLELERQDSGIRNMLEHEAMYQGSKVVTGGTPHLKVEQREDMGNRFQSIIRVPADEIHEYYLQLRGALQQTLSGFSATEETYTITAPGLLSLRHLCVMLSEDKDDDATFNGQYL